MSQQITKLTPEQEAQIEVYKNRYIPHVYGGGYYERFNYEDAKNLVEWEYKLAGEKIPVTITVNNPYEGQMIFSSILNNCPAILTEMAAMKNSDNFDQAAYDEKYAIFRKYCDDIIARGEKPTQYSESYLFTSDIFTNVLLSWYGYMIDVLKVETEVKETFLEWRELYEKAGIFNTICGDVMCVVSKFPKAIHKNDNYDLHRTDGVAVEWDGYEWKNYFINGRNISSTDYELALHKKLTRKRFMEEKNEDTRAAWNEILGPAGMMEVLGADEISRGTIEHNNGEVETVILFKTKESFPEAGNQPLAWVQFTCPSTGSKYMINVEPKYTDAVKAAVSTNPFNLKPEEYHFDERG